MNTPPPPPTHRSVGLTYLSQGTGSRGDFWSHPTVGVAVVELKGSDRLSFPGVELQLSVGMIVLARVLPLV